MRLFVKQGLLMAVLCGGLTILNANADPIEIPGNADEPLQGTGPGGGNGNSPMDDFYRLQQAVTAYDLLHPGTPLPTPSFTGDDPISSQNISSPGLTGFDYIVLHYGVGNSGIQMTGGGVEIFYLNGEPGWNFPANGTGPNGTGGFSGAVLYEGTPVASPETATTGILMAVCFGMLALTKRFVRAKAS